MPEPTRALTTEREAEYRTWAAEGGEAADPSERGARLIAGDVFAEVDRLRATLDRALKALVLTHDYLGHEGLPMIEGWEWFDASREIVAVLPETMWTREFTARVADAPKREGPRG